VRVRELLLGVTLGLSTGISPGPLLALVIGATLRNWPAAFPHHHGECWALAVEFVPVAFG